MHLPNKFLHAKSCDLALFDSLDGSGAYSQLFYAVLKFATLDGNFGWTLHNGSDSNLS